jgi:hypothetical protein
MGISDWMVNTRVKRPHKTPSPQLCRRPRRYIPARSVEDAWKRRCLKRQRAVADVLRPATAAKLRSEGRLPPGPDHVDDNVFKRDFEKAMCAWCAAIIVEQRLLDTEKGNTMPLP